MEILKANGEKNVKLPRLLGLLLVLLLLVLVVFPGFRHRVFGFVSHRGTNNSPITAVSTPTPKQEQVVVTETLRETPTLERPVTPVATAQGGSGAPVVATKTPVPPAQSGITGFLKVSGNKIVDPQGNIIYLRGFQGFDAYPIPDDVFIKAVYQDSANSYAYDEIAQDILQYTITDFDINEIKSTGANVIRLWTNVYEIQRGPGEYSEVALSMLEDTINRFGENGIYTILVMAGAGENTYEPQQVYRTLGINLWDAKSTAQQDSITVWGVLSQRFSNNPFIAGYDVMNEPMPPTADALHTYYVGLIREIRRHDKNHIIILPVAQGANAAAFQIGGKYDDANVMITFHFYYPHNFTLEPGIPNQTYPGTYDNKYWDKAALEKVFETALSLPELQGKPIYIGEFGAGAERDGAGGLEWTRDVTEIMNRYGLNYTYHTYKHKVHKGYWIKKPEAQKAFDELVSAIANGQMQYSDLIDGQKRDMFMTQYAFYRREGIKEILTKAFTDK